MHTHVECLPDSLSICFGAVHSSGVVGCDTDYWYPVQRKRVFFMRGIECCPACRWIKPVSGNSFGGLLHVVVCGDRLIVTECDDLLRPGRVLTGNVIAESAQTSVFCLAAEAPDGLDPKRHHSIQGIARLTWVGVRRLQIFGNAERAIDRHDTRIDAFESSYS